MKLKDILDMEEYLKNRCYCPGEIYSADGYNLTPFVIAFKDWCDYMKNKIDKDDNYD
jgi:hypothetical protein